MVTNPSATGWSEAGWLKRGKSDITMINVQGHGWVVLNPTGEHVGAAWNIFVRVMSPLGTKGAEACVHQRWSVTGGGQFQRGVINSLIPQACC